MQLKLTCNGCGRNVEISGEFGKGVNSVPCPGCQTPLEIPPNILDVGDVIGGFQIEKHLGSGAMGSVYLAKQVSMDRQVAIKVMAKDKDLSERAADDFLKEIRLLGKLDHPNIVGAFEAGEDKGHYYVAMRYLQGETLERRIERDGPIDEKEALRIVLKLADALDCAWEEHSITHRDLKPDNIMLTHGDEPVLLDLGISKVQGTKTQHTISGQILGTPLYMSPEQARDSANVDLRTDIYSMGCTLFHALAGRVPFDAPDVVGVLMKHSLDPIPTSILSKAGISQPCIELVQQMMAKNPNDRHETWPKLINHVKRVLNGKSQKRPAKRRPPPPRQQRMPKPLIKPAPKRGSTALILVAGLLILLGISGLVYLVASGNSQAPPPIAQAPSVAAVVQEFPEEPSPTKLLPPGWKLTLVGSMEGGATAAYANRQLKIESYGKDVWAGADDFAFVHRNVRGDFSIVVRVDSFSGERADSMAGIMVRPNVSPSTRHAAVYVSPNGLVLFKHRREDGKSTRSYKLPQPLKKPTWLKISRRRNEVLVYGATDPRTWHPLGRSWITLPQKVEVGFFVCSHSSSKQAHAAFSNLRISADATTPTVQRLVLVSAATGKDLELLSSGDHFSLRKTGRRLNILARATGNFGSIQFLYDGRRYMQGRMPPYFMADDDRQGKPYSWTPTLGKHTLLVTPWSEKGARGKRGVALHATFTVTE